jgi:hypothetical protein
MSRTANMGFVEFRSDYELVPAATSRAYLSLAELEFSANFLRIQFVSKWLRIGSGLLQSHRLASARASFDPCPTSVVDKNTSIACNAFSPVKVMPDVYST